MATIRDIARRAGVSIGSVSNYLNNPDLVSEETRESIRRAIQELGYYPHAAARSLKSNQTRRVGLVPLISPEENRSLEPSDNAFLEFLAAVNTTAAEQDYGVLLYAATSQAAELSIYERLVGERQVDGLILMGTRALDARIEFLSKQQFPFVSFGRSQVNMNHAYVDVDGAKGIAEAVKHLAQLGHRRIGYIAPPNGLMCAVHRWEGFCSAMAEHNLPIDDELVVEGGFSEKSGQVAMHLLLDLPHPPTAVIAANDLCAFGAMRALQMRGLIAGQDVSIVGFDDIRLAAHWYPSLTTVSQPFRRIGSIVAQMLLDIIAGKEVEQHIIVEPRLVVRNSTGPLKQVVKE
ncbi:MAG: LacI family DNA-binding transcriptional regulator [Chloroflexi bacterium]|nr:LacI family DNA-binding transcriptional regulator [Chloroflexota bacterium]